MKCNMMQGVSQCQSPAEKLNDKNLNHATVSDTSRSLPKSGESNIGTLLELELEFYLFDRQLHNIGEIISKKCVK